MRNSILFLFISILATSIAWSADFGEKVWGTADSGGGVLGAGNYTAMNDAKTSGLAQEGDLWWLTDNLNTDCTDGGAGTEEVSCSFNSSGNWVATGIAGGSSWVGTAASNLDMNTNDITFNDTTPSITSLNASADLVIDTDTAGTGEVRIVSENWGVDTSGNISTTGTVDGADLNIDIPGLKDGSLITTLDIDILANDTVDDNLLDLVVGGTGASTASGARTALGVAIGADVQAWDSDGDLDDIAALTEQANDILFFTGGAWTRDNTPAIVGSDFTGINPATATNAEIWYAADYASASGPCAGTSCTGGIVEALAACATGGGGIAWIPNGTTTIDASDASLPAGPLWTLPTVDNGNQNITICHLKGYGDSIYAKPADLESSSTIHITNFKDLATFNDGDTSGPDFRAVMHIEGSDAILEDFSLVVTSVPDAVTHTPDDTGDGVGTGSFSMGVLIASGYGAAVLGEANVGGVTFRNVSVKGDGLGGGGVGVLQYASLKANFFGGEYAGWDTGIRMAKEPTGGGATGNQNNAVGFFGTKIRENVVGLLVNESTDFSTHGITNEGNTTGIQHASTSLAVHSDFGSHFENNSSGANLIIDSVGASFVGVGTRFGGLVGVGNDIIRSTVQDGSGSVNGPDLCVGCYVRHGFDYASGSEIVNFNPRWVEDGTGGHSAATFPGAGAVTNAGTDTITTTEILDGTILVGDMAADSVDSAQYADGSIDLAHMASASVDSDNIVDDTITASDLNGTLTMGATDVVTFAANDSTTGALIIPQVGSACAGATVAGEICWDSASDVLYVGDGVGGPTSISGSGTDADAIHDNVASEISVVTEKVTPVSGDFLLIEDSAAANVKKRIQIGNLPAGGGATTSGSGVTYVTTLTDDFSVGAIDSTAEFSFDVGTGDLTFNGATTPSIVSGDATADFTIDTDTAGTGDVIIDSVAWNVADGGLANFATVTSDGASTLTGETDLGTSPTAFSNTSITLQLDEDANGAESLIVNDGADAAVFTFEETGVIALGATLNDDVCDVEGEFWYDTTNNAFEFCQATSGAPTTLGGGSGATTSGSGVTYVTTLTDDFSIGAVDSTAEFSFDVGTGDLTFNGATTPSIISGDATADFTIDTDTAGTGDVIIDSVAWNVADGGVMTAQSIQDVDGPGTDWSISAAGAADFAGAVTAPSFTADPSATPSMILEMITTGVQGSIELSETDPDGVMDLRVDEVDTLVTYVQLDGVSETVEINKRLVAENILDTGTRETFSASDLTPDVSTGSFFITNATQASITDFDGTGIDAGQVITVESAGATTYDCTTSGFQCGTVDIVTAAGDLTSWLYDGTDWHLIAFTDQSTDMGTDDTGSGSLGSNLTSTTNDILSNVAVTGAVVLGGAGNTNNEALTLDFETTANEVGVSSTTAAAVVDFGTINVEADQLVSDVTTGTAPLVVASATVVTNLNADTVDGEEASAIVTASRVGGVSANLDAADASIEWEDAAALDATGALSTAYLPLAGGTMTGSILTDNLGIEFDGTTDTNPTCGAGDYHIYADLSDTTLKKCVNGSATDLDTSGGTTTIDALGDAAGIGAVQLGTNQEYGQTWTWNTPATTVGALDGLSLVMDLDATTDAQTQNVLVVERSDGAGTTAMESLVQINNNEASAAVTSGIEITSAAGTITTGIDLTDADIVTAIDIGNNDFKVAGAILLDDELIELQTIDSSTLEVGDWQALAAFSSSILPVANGGTGQSTAFGTGVGTGLGTNVNTGAGFVTTTGTATLTNKTIDATGTNTLIRDVEVGIDSDAWVLHATTPPTEATFGTTFPRNILQFADAADDIAGVQVEIPSIYDNSVAPTMTVRWTSSATTSSACWCLSNATIADSGDTTPTATDTDCVDTAVDATTTDLNETVITLTGADLVAGQTSVFQLYRDVDAGDANCTTDALGASADLHSSVLTFQVSE